MTAKFFPRSSVGWPKGGDSLEDKTARVWDAPDDVLLLADLLKLLVDLFSKLLARRRF